jgi:hypothetical protein
VKIVSKITKEHVGKFTVLRADNRQIPVQIMVVGGGMIIWKVMDDNLWLRSGQSRYDVEKAVDIFDTVEEMMESL